MALRVLRPVALAASVLLGVTLAGCTAPVTHTPVHTAAPAAAVPAETPAETPSPVVTPTPSPTATTPPTAIDCVESPTARINTPNYAYNTRDVTKPELVGQIYDTGPRAHAMGRPTLIAGKISSYVMQPGDTVYAIAQRFCLAPNSLAAFNDTLGYDMHVGDVVLLRPDPSKPWHPKN